MSRDQRPGTIRVFADRPQAPLNRRQGEMRPAAGNARKAALAAALPAAPRRHWLTIPIWLFAIGFVVGGIATAVRHLLGWTSL